MVIALGVAFAAAMLVSAIGFKKYVWLIPLYSVEKYKWLVA